MCTRKSIRLSTLAALLVLPLVGCAPAWSPPHRRPPRPSQALRDATSRQYRLIVREVPTDPTPTLLVELVQLDVPHDSRKAPKERRTATAAQPWRFCPGFFLLPLAPARTAIGLTGAAGLTSCFASTYLLRWGAGTAGAGVCVVVGSVVSGEPTLRWARAPWAWAWDSESHASFWGVKPERGQSPLEQCVAFAFDYSRYSLSPILPDWERPAEAPVATDAGLASRSRAGEHEPRCAIRELSASVRANRADSEELLLIAPIRAPTRGPATLPIGRAIEAFCYDDELTLELIAVPASAPSQPVAARHVTRVARWRRPGGPRIYWLVPAHVVTGGTLANPVRQKELAVKVLLRADTPDAPITQWQIKQDGKVRGGAFASPGQVGLGRAVLASSEAKIEFEEPGDRTTLAVFVEAGNNRKASSTAAFVFSPSR